MFKNLRIKHALFAGYVALVFSFIGCAINPIEPDSAKVESWSQISALPIYRSSFQSVVLPNSDILLMGGDDGSIGGVDQRFTRFSRNDIWLSSNRGENWNEITSSSTWPARRHFQSVVLQNGDILVMGGHSVILFSVNYKNDIWLSKDSGRTWSEIPASSHWSARDGFQAVVLNNNDILVMGGHLPGNTSADIFLSKDGGTNWSQIPAADHWSPRENFQAVVLANNDILVMGGYDGDYRNDVWKSKDGGTNWSEITKSASWDPRISFQAVAMNDDILVMGGTTYDPTYREVFTNRRLITNSVVVFTNTNVVVFTNTNSVVVFTNVVAYTNTYANAKTLNNINDDGVVTGVSTYYPDPNVVVFVNTNVVVFTNNDPNVAVFTNTEVVVYTNINATPRTTHNTYLNGIQENLGGIWLSSDGGVNWNNVASPEVPSQVSTRHDFQATVLPNDEVLIMGGYAYFGLVNNNPLPRSSDVWRLNF